MVQQERRGNIFIKPELGELAAEAQFSWVPEATVSQVQGLPVTVTFFSRTQGDWAYKWVSMTQLKLNVSAGRRAGAGTHSSRLILKAGSELIRGPPRRSSDTWAPGPSNVVGNRHCSYGAAGGSPVCRTKTWKWQQAVHFLLGKYSQTHRSEKREICKDSLAGPGNEQSSLGWTGPRDNSLPLQHTDRFQYFQNLPDTMVEQCPIPHLPTAQIY